MVVDRFEPAGEIILDGKTYRMVRIPPAAADQLGQFDYSVNFSDEPPYVQGAPAILSDPQFTWHLGDFKSRQGIQGSSEYGQNVDKRWAFRMLPAPLRHDLTLSGSYDFFGPNPVVEDGPILCIFEAFGFIFATSAKNIWRINPSTDEVILSATYTLGGGEAFNDQAGVMGLVWEGKAYFTQSSDNTVNFISLQESDLSAVTGTPDVYNHSPDVDAMRLAVGINRLFKISRTGVLRDIVTGLDPIEEDNWADSVQIGDPGTMPTALLSYQRTVLAGKPEGFFGVGDDGFGMSLIQRMPKETNNVFGAASFDPWTLVPYVRGLYWYQPGIVQAIGLEVELLNQSPIHGRWTGFATDGQWIYGLMTVGSNTYVLAGRERIGNEAGFGKIVWSCWLYFTGLSSAIFQSALTTTPRLWFGKGTNLSYVELSEAPGSVEYALSGSQYLTKEKFDDWNPKDFPYVDVVGTNLSSTKYWVINYSIDGGAFSDQDINSSQMKLDSNGKTRFFLPKTAVGQEIQIRLDYTSNSSSSPPEINYVEVFAVPQSKKIQAATFALGLETGIRTVIGSDRRSSQEQLNDLITLVNSPDSVKGTGPWGKDLDCWVKNVQVVTQRYLHLAPSQRGDSDPNYMVVVTLGFRKEA